MQNVNKEISIKIEELFKIVTRHPIDVYDDYELLKINDALNSIGTIINNPKRLPVTDALNAKDVPAGS